MLPKMMLGIFYMFDKTERIVPILKNFYRNVTNFFRDFTTTNTYPQLKDLNSKVTLAQKFLVSLKGIFVSERFSTESAFVSGGGGCSGRFNSFYFVEYLVLFGRCFGDFSQGFHYSLNTSLCN